MRESTLPRRTLTYGLGEASSWSFGSPPIPISDQKCRHLTIDMSKRRSMWERTSPQEIPDLWQGFTLTPIFGYLDYLGDNF